MKEKDLKYTLQQEFSFEKNWKSILALLFGKIDYFSTPSNPFFEQEKVLSGKQIGTIKLDDNKSLAIFEVEVDDSIRIDQNRKGLRDIAAKHIDQNITHAALVFFYSRNQVDYRFSFIAKWSNIDLETGEFLKGETKPKRYTYLLGGNESCTTAAKRLLELAEKKATDVSIGVKQLLDAFSVEALNKSFFKSYKEHYEKFWGYIANPEFGYRNILIDTSKEDPIQQEKPIRDFVKKLLGRIVFLHFLQKKDWMGCPANSTQWEGGEKQFLQKLYANFEHKEKFHSRCLTQLFFNTLNTKRRKDVFEIEGLTSTLNGSRVPYLNGGLFDTDKPQETQTIDFPVKYFEELLEFFAQYNFTIDENSPDDHEIGIDPEMLGHIFENLLEENREKGAFYTPKEVVQYMCKESTIQYLKNHFPEEAKIDGLIRGNLVSEYFAERDNAIALDQKLNKIKVCDPAIGSGAFLIGILQEIFEAKRLIYHYLKTIKEFNPAKVKKDIIQNSIYGVDIEKGAVDIAQLRFWLALVVDETEPQPLPNLDYKIMQGNTLLESYEGIDLSKVALFEEPKVTIVQQSIFEEPKKDYGFSEESRTNIKQLVKDYFMEEDNEEKTRIHKSIDRIVLDHIDKSLEFFENRLLIEIATYEKYLKSKLESLNGNQKEQYLSKSKEAKEIAKRKKQLENKAEARKKLLDFEKTDERPYFLWHLYFMDVFERGGFDIFIGNPPYIQLQKMDKDADILQEEKFETFKRTGDIYTLFYEKGIKLLKDDGVLTYITSNTWMRTKFGEGLREYFISHSNPIKLLNFEDTKIFPSATVEVNIMLTKKEKWNNGLQAVAIKGDYLPGMSINDYLNKKQIILTELDKESWVIVEKEDFEIKSQIESKGILLKDWNIEFYRGFLTGLNDAFFISKETRDELVSTEQKCEKIIKPLLRGRNIHKYHYKFDDLYVLFIPWHFPLQDEPTITGASNIAEKEFKKEYPATYNHLNQFRKSLSNRNKSETGIRYEWYALQRPAATYSEEFEKDKIVWLSISDKPAFALDTNKMYVTAPAYIMTSNCNKYLLTMLNSKVMEWYLDKVSSSTGQGTNQWSKIFVEKLPIPELNTEERKPFEILADYLTLINDPKILYLFESISAEIVSRFFDEVLNMMVYELYFEEHMKENKIDVLKFIDFENISLLETFEEKRDVIQKEYYKLKEKDNPIRNRILLSSTRSPNIIKRINESTH